MQRPQQLGLRHLALTVTHLEACVTFYRDIIGMTIEWQPDADNVYLTSGNDNLALHRAKTDINHRNPQALDHLGFIVKTPEEVQRWYDFMDANQVTLKSPVKAHRDGAHSFYCTDPDGNPVQIIYHPPLVSK